MNTNGPLRELDPWAKPNATFRDPNALSLDLPISTADPSRVCHPIHPPLTTTYLAT
jgi:hypothetical protein